MAPPPPVEEEVDSWGGSISVGYDSKYDWRGQDLSGSAALVWSELTLSFFDEHLGLGAWYADYTKSSDNELDLWIELSHSLGPVDVAGGLLYYYYPSLDGVEGEQDDTFEPYFSIGTGIDLWNTYFNFYTGYDTEEDGWYFEVTTDMSFSVVEDCLAIEPYLTISYGIDYFNDAEDDNGFNHFEAGFSFPITLKENVTLSPYVAVAVPLDTLDDQHDDEWWGGVSFSVDF